MTRHAELKPAVGTNREIPTPDPPGTLAATPVWLHRVHADGLPGAPVPAPRGRSISSQASSNAGSRVSDGY
jgi:hypothetical protein